VCRIAAGFERWSAVLSEELRLLHAGGKLAPRIDPDDLATTLLAALQGGLLLAQVQRRPQLFETVVDAAHRWSPTQYAENAPPGTASHMTAAQALQYYQSNSTSAADNAKKGLTPTLHHWLWSDSSWGVSRRPVWVIMFKSVETEEVGRGVTHAGCTETFWINDETGEGMWDSFDCPSTP
jgi:hypothetical protein